MSKYMKAYIAQYNRKIRKKERKHYSQPNDQACAWPRGILMLKWEWCAEESQSRYK
jgi:hypothetical protein